MSYTPQDQKEHRAVIAMELLAFKAKLAIEKAKGSKYDFDPSLYVDELNECFMVAGMPLINPKSGEDKEIKVVNLYGREETE